MKAYNAHNYLENGESVMKEIQRFTLCELAAPVKVLFTGFLFDYTALFRVGRCMVVYPAFFIIRFVILLSE